MNFRRRTDLGIVVALGSLLFMDTGNVIGVYDALLMYELRCHPNLRTVG